MTSFLERDRLLAEQAAIKEIIDGLTRDDFLGKRSLENRLSWVEEQLRALGDERSTRAQVALAFDGGPVFGDHGIDAEFSSKVLHSFQSTVSTIFAANANEGFIGERGPTVGAKDSTLKITGVVHGSFGFVLEEIDASGEQWTDSALLNATNEAVKIVERVSAENTEDADSALDSVSFRLIKDLEEFFGAIHSQRATLKISQAEHTSTLDRTAIERAYERVKDATVEEREEQYTGELLGILPDSRRFEFGLGSEVLKGLAIPAVVQAYVFSVQSQQSLVGRPVQGVFRVKQIDRPSAPTRIVYTLLAVNPLT